jgi:OOP family OmpA-OmpF porin
MQGVRQSMQGGQHIRRVLALSAAVIGLSAAMSAFAADDSYLTDSRGEPVTTGYGQCVHGMNWNKSMPPCPEPTVVVDDEQVKIVFAIDDSEFFGFDKVTLGDKTKDRLDRMAAAIKSASDVHGILVTGHTDRIGPEPYNVELAQKRADAVKAYLVSKGLPAAKIEAVGEGLKEPWVKCPDISKKDALIQCLAPNRRVDVVAVLADDIDVQDVTILPPSD